MKFTVVRSQTVKSPRIDRAGQDDTWIIYTLDTGKAGSVTLPTASPTDQEIVDAVEAEERKHGALQGRTFGG